MTIIAGRLITLRAATVNDALAIEPAYGDMRAVATNRRAPPRPDHVSRKRPAAASGADRPAFAIIANESGAYCGKVSLHGIDAHHRSVRQTSETRLTDQCELGIVLLPECRRRGYGIEALSLLLDYATRTRGFHRVAMMTLADNEGALHVARKLGFAIDGVRREAQWFDGRFADIVCLSLLDREWRESAAISTVDA